jgi:hypothetical protein
MNYSEMLYTATKYLHVLQNVASHISTGVQRLQYLRSIPVVTKYHKKDLSRGKKNKSKFASSSFKGRRGKKILIVYPFITTISSHMLAKYTFRFFFVL